MSARSTISVVLAATVASLVAACGGDDARTTPSSPASAASTGAEGTTTAVADGGPTTSTTAVPSTTAAAAPSTAAAPETTRATPAPTTQPTSTTQPALFDFGADGSVDGWGVVNDTVMGGVSSGQLALTDGVLVFTGDLSLENNGGFASMRSPAIDPQQAAEWATRPGPRIQVEGDGRTWTVEVRTLDGDGGWIAPLSTSPDGTTDTELPWAEFEPVTRFLDPRDTDVPLDPARIVSIAFYLVDGIEGPFTLGVRSIG
jgi:hypothetical protein